MSWGRLDAFSTSPVWSCLPCHLPGCRKSATVWIHERSFCDYHGGAFLTSKLEAAIREREKEALAGSPV